MSFFIIIITIIRNSLQTILYPLLRYWMFALEFPVVLINLSMVTIKSIIISSIPNSYAFPVFLKANFWF